MLPTLSTSPSKFCALSTSPSKFCGISRRVVSSQQASLLIVHMYRAEPLVQLPTNLVSMVPDKTTAIHTSGGHERAEKKILFLMSVAQEQNAGDFGDSAGHCLPWRLRQPLPSRCFGAPPSPVTLCGRCLRHSRNPRLPSRTPATNHPPLYLCTRVAMQTMTSPAMSLPLSLSLAVVHQPQKDYFSSPALMEKAAT
jgi:hypothetical protein